MPVLLQSDTRVGSLMKARSKGAPGRRKTQVRVDGSGKRVNLLPFGSRSLEVGTWLRILNLCSQQSDGKQRRQRKRAA